MAKLIDLTGKRFGRLIVIKRMNNDKWGRAQWLCLCECQKKKIVPGNNLRRGDTKSCGCLRKEATGQRATKHGYSQIQSKTYRAWKHMRSRCNNPRDKDYCHYGGRGITICEEWEKFENFLKDMGEVPEGYQIDRIDNNKRYCRSNCQWTTAKINNRNKRNNLYFTYKNKTQLLIEWAEEFNICPYVLGSRTRRGWSLEKALTTPIRKRRKKK